METLRKMFRQQKNIKFFIFDVLQGTCNTVKGVLTVNSRSLKFEYKLINNVLFRER